MIISKLMNNKIILILLLIIVTNSQTDSDHTNQHQALSTSQAWGFGILTGAGISIVGILAAVLIICLRKCMEESSFKTLINLLYALGCGALVGDAMVHILPEAYSNVETNSNIVSLVFIIAVFTFILIERFFVCCGIAHKHWGDQTHDQCREHEHQCQKKSNHHEERDPRENCEMLNAEQVIDGKQEEKRHSIDTSNENPKFSNANNELLHSSTKINPETIQQDIKEKSCCQQLKGKNSSGYLIMVSELIHNFFDGFAIGVGFASRDPDQFIPVIVAVFAHEIPSEMGNVGILLKSKFSTFQTICCNAFINTSALIGVVLGLGLGQLGETVQIYILTFVAGNFIYIGADIWRNLMKKQNACLNFLEFLSFCIGVGAMYLVLLAESGDEHSH